MRAVIALAVKDLKLLARDKFGLFWVAVFPLLMALFFGSIFSSGGGSARGLRVGFVGTGDSASIAAFRDALAASDVMTVEEMPLDSARDLVARGKRVAYVHYIDTSESNFGPFGPGQPSIEVGIDPARQAERGYLQGLVTQAHFRVLRDGMMDPKTLRPKLEEQMATIDTLSDMDEDQRRILSNLFGSLDQFMANVDSVSDSDTTSLLANSPFGDPQITFEEVTVSRMSPKTAWEITFPQSLQWALIGVAAAFGVSIVVERRRGTFLRLRLAPISRLQILLGKGMACFLACLVSSALLLSIGILIFGIRVQSPAGLVVAVLSAAFCFVGIMMLISVLGKTEQAVAGAGWAILLVMSMTGGGLVPLMAMPNWMFKLGHISAVKWSILAMEGAIWRGFGPAEMAQPIIILLSVGVVGFGVGTYVLSRTD